MVYFKANELNEGLKAMSRQLIATFQRKGAPTRGATRRRSAARLAVAAFALSLSLGVLAATRVDTLRAKIASGDRDYVFVAMHRGDWRNYPENSIDAVKSCIALGADVVELDVARTKDGHFVLSHDDTLDRATTGKGKVEDRTLAEIRELRLRSGSGGPDAPATTYGILTLEEALDAARGRILVNIDKFPRYPKAILDAVKAAGCISNVIVKADWSAETLRRMIGEDYWAMIEKGDLLYMPIVNVPDRSGRSESWFRMEPRANSVYECCFADDAGEQVVIGLQARFPSARVWVNTLWRELCNGHMDHRALRGEADACWGWCIDTAKATFIQTDAGKELIDYLKTHGRRNL